MGAKDNNGWINAKGNFPKEGVPVFAYWKDENDTYQYGVAYHVINEWYRRADLETESNMAVFEEFGGRSYIVDVIPENVEGWIPIPTFGEFMGVDDQNEEVTDNVNHPSHYKSGGYECIDVMLAIFGPEKVAAYCECNTFKYLWRHDKKNGLEDMRKANWYIEKFIELSTMIEEREQ